MQCVHGGIALTPTQSSTTNSLPEPLDLGVITTRCTFISAPKSTNHQGFISAGEQVTLSLRDVARVLVNIQVRGGFKQPFTMASSLLAININLTLF